MFYLHTITSSSVETSIYKSITVIWIQRSKFSWTQLRHWVSKSRIASNPDIDQVIPLDLVMTEVLGKLNVLQWQTGPYLSDLCSIMTQVAKERTDIEKQAITYRKVNKIDTDCMSDEIKSDLEGLQHLDLNKMVSNLSSILANSLDKRAPEKTKTILTRKKNHWFTDSLGEFKRSLHQMERSFRKYGEDHQWTALKIQCNIYHNALKNSRHEIFNEKVSECG